MHTEEEIITAIKKIIQRNSFINDMNFKSRAQQNLRLEKALKVLKEVN